ncbi:MAG: YIP1 family protein [Thermoanaerobaculia bacterium]
MNEFVEPQGPPVPAPKPNPFERLFGVLFSPGEAMASIASKPTWLIPMVVLILVSVGTSIVVKPHIDIESAMRKQFEERNVPQDQQETAIAVATTMQKVSVYLSVVWVPVSILIVAAVFLLVFKTFGGTGTFGQFFGVTVWAWIPAALKWILFAGILSTKGMVDPTQIPVMIKSSLAFLSSPSHPMMFAFLSSIDIFALWTLALLVLGYAASSKFSRTKSAVLVFSVWAIVILGKVGLASLQTLGGKV